MKWEHTCDIDWMRARRACLTATDIKELLPVSKTGRPRKVTDENYIKVYARKLEEYNTDDCKSYGAAARGHIMETFALTELGKITGGAIFHWDDFVIKSKKDDRMLLGFSPDGMDVMMPDPALTGRLLYAKDVNAKRIYEVKSYSPEHHLRCVATKSAELEERWQLAAAMAAMPSIERATLVFWNPKLNYYRMHIREYTRANLEDEIETVLNIEEDWLKFVDDLVEYKLSDGASYSYTATEQEIIDELEREARESLNPC